MKLTARQRAFCAEYIIDLSAGNAARRAGYSAKTAREQGYELLRKPAVLEEIERLKAERQLQTKVDAAWVLARLSAEATADIGELYDDNGALKPVHDWPLIWRQGLVQSIEVDEIWEGEGADRVQVGVTKRIKLDSRVKRVELIGKHVTVKAFTDVVEHKGLDALADRLARAKKRGNDEPRLPPQPALPAVPGPSETASEGGALAGLADRLARLRGNRS